MNRLNFIYTTILGLLWPMRSRSNAVVTDAELIDRVRRSRLAKEWLDANGFKNQTSDFEIGGEEYKKLRVWYEDKQGRVAWPGCQIAWPSEAGSLVIPWQGAMRVIADMGFRIEHYSSPMTISTDENRKEIKLARDPASLIAVYEFPRPAWL